MEDWDTAQQRWTDHVIAEPSFEAQLMFATLQLPIDLLRAAHKRLFGQTTDEPSEEAIRTIGFALFNPQTPDHPYRSGKMWWQYCLKANGSRREQVMAAVADLLMSWTTDDANLADEVLALVSATGRRVSLCRQWLLVPAMKPPRTARSIPIKQSALTSLRHWTAGRSDSFAYGETNQRT